MCKKGLKRFIGIFVFLLLLAVMGGTASAQVFDLCTGRTTMTMPDGEMIPAWGFGIEDSTPTCESATVPGPVLEVPVGAPLTINLRNTLPEPVSLNIAGQILFPNNGPVWSELDGTPAPNPRASGNYNARVRSFAHEANANDGTNDGTASYTWPNFRVGSYLLTSGTNPAKQVQMGLYLAVKKDAAAGMAYADDPETAGDESVPYDKELILVYSEVDPLIQAAINEGTYGYHADPVPAGWITSSLHRDPKYFLINGMAFEPAGGLDPINSMNFIGPDQKVLVRFLNTGYETHVPQLLNMYMSLVAEDGNPYAYPKQQYGVQLPAGKTIDAVIVVPGTISRFSIHDAALHLTNNGTADPGGMLAFVETVDTCFGNIAPDPLDTNVNELDLAVFAQDFGRADCDTVGPPCPGDIHPTGAPDGDVDGLDLFTLTQEFGRTNCP